MANRKVKESYITNNRSYKAKQNFSNKTNLKANCTFSDKMNSTEITQPVSLHGSRLYKANRIKEVDIDYRRCLLLQSEVVFKHQEKV
jgi:hypothetical protein